MGTLNGIKIGIAVSEPDGVETTKFKKFVEDLAELIMTEGATLVYGGDLRENGYTWLFTDIAGKMKDKNDKPFFNYFSYPIHCQLTKDHRKRFSDNSVEFESVPSIIEDDNTTFFPPDTIQNKYLWAKNLTQMRKNICEKVDAYIFIGGRNTKYVGMYAGIVEEAYHLIDSGKPVYLLGGFNGATKRIIGAIEDRTNVIDLNDSYFNESDYVNFVQYFNQMDSKNKINNNIINSNFRRDKFSLINILSNNKLNINDFNEIKNSVDAKTVFKFIKPAFENIKSMKAYRDFPGVKYLTDDEKLARAIPPSKFGKAESNNFQKNQEGGQMSEGNA